MQSRQRKVKHYSSTEGEAPLTPQFRPDNDAGFRPLSGPGAAQPQKKSFFTPMSNAASKEQPQSKTQVAAHAESSEGPGDVEMGVAEAPVANGR